MSIPRTAAAAALLLCLAVRSFAGPAEEGRAALAAGRGKDAAPLLSAAVEGAPGDLDLRADLGRALSWSGRYEEAARAYEAVLSSRPDHREALLGLARLEGYRGRFKDALAAVDRGLAAHPGDRELSAERARLGGLLRDSRCALRERFTVRCGWGGEDYSFSGPGNGVSASFRDRRFRGWDAAVAASYEHRFALDDLDLGVSASRKAFGGWGGFSLGGATRHVLLPALRASLDGGARLGRGFGAEGKLAFRRYDNAKVLSFSPALAWEGRGLALTAGYSVSSTYYDSGARSGALSSFSARAAWLRSCPVIPWIGYSRTREAFEAGSAAGARSFSADHFSAGAALHLPGGFAVDAYASRERRPASGQTITRAGAGAAYSWGGAP